jgi:cytochrome c oxidase subunit 2
MRADPKVIKHWENINVIHNERKRRIGEEEEKVDFNYILLCNKICGAGHSNMQLNVIVETQEQFNQWIENKGTKKRLTFSGQEVDWPKTNEQASL